MEFIPRNWDHIEKDQNQKRRDNEEALQFIKDLLAHDPWGLAEYRPEKKDFTFDEVAEIMVEYKRNLILTKGI